jgi:hypothetical protein
VRAEHDAAILEKLEECGVVIADAFNDNFGARLDLAKLHRVGGDYGAVGERDRVTVRVTRGAPE